MVQVASEFGTAVLRELVLGEGRPFDEGFVGDQVAGVFELPRMGAQVSVGQPQGVTQFGEGQSFVARERADDPEPRPLVDEGIQGQGLGRVRRSLVRAGICLLYTSPSPRD